MLVQAFFAIALSLGPSVQDVPAPQDKGIVVTGEANKQNKRVCKRSVSTGSVMQKVICKTAGEWNAESDRSVATLERLRSQDRWNEAVTSEKGLLPPDARAN